MITALIFSIIAAGLVFLAGCKDAARDPRLTLMLLVLTALFPLMAAVLPKMEILPAAVGTASGAEFPTGKILFGIWALGFVIAVGRLGVAARELVRWKKTAIEISQIDGVSICELAGLRGPVAAGIFRKTIFVPASWSEWPEESRRVVLAHELAHLQRRDPLWRLLTELACAVHWYHPLVRWMARRCSIQCEYACDAMVLRKGIDAKAYARVLCDCAEARSSSSLALSLAEGPALESRVRRMLLPAGSFSGKTLVVLGGLGLVAASLLAMIGRQSLTDSPIPQKEIQLRLSANPFPGES